MRRWLRDGVRRQRETENVGEKQGRRSYFLYAGNSLGTILLRAKNKGVRISSNPLFLFVVAGLGFEPRTFGV
jgi:hypothetical protein